MQNLALSIIKVKAQMKPINQRLYLLAEQMETHKRAVAGLSMHGTQFL